MAEATPPSAEALAAKAPTLRKTVTKTGGGAAASAEVAAMAKVWTDNGGDAAKVAAAGGWDAKKITANMPSDASEFGKKALAGAYSSD